ncbi:MAG TPA: DUF1559 domain-containing protein [Pirellulales bacterium]
MSILFVCPHCGLETEVSDEYAGQSGPCVGCGKLVTMPLPGQAGFGSESLAALPRATRRRGLTSLLLAVAALGLCMSCLIGVLIAIFMPALQRAGANARRQQCAANLQRIGLAMQNYYTDYGSFPPGHVTDAKGRPLHSWRALLLPYLDPALAAQYHFDEPWDGPRNTLLADQVPDVYRCPDDALSAVSNTTDYVVINGADTIFDGSKCTKLAEITDGAANTLLVVEVVESGIVWLEPRDLRIEQITGGVNSADEVASNHAGGANVLTADGKTHFLHESRGATVVREMATKAGEEMVAP